MPVRGQKCFFPVQCCEFLFVRHYLCRWKTICNLAFFPARPVSEKAREDVTAKRKKVILREIRYNLQNDIESNAPTSDGTNPSTSNVPVEPFESAPKFISSNCLETIDKAPPSSTTQYFLSSNNHSILDHQCDVFPPSRALKRSFDVIENEPNESTEIQTNPVLLVAKNRKTSRIDASTTLLLSQFEIDWSIIPFDIISQLENTTESVLNETDYNRFVDHIVGQTRNITTSTPLSVYRQIAQVIVNKYNFFIDVDDDGIIIGNGCSSLIEKLKNRNSYLNRAHKSGHHNKNLKLGDDPMRQCRIGIRDNYYFTGEPHVPKSCLQKLLKNIGWDMDLLTSSKSYIRFKMDSSSINDLMDNFPILRRKAFLEYHFFEATGVEAENFKNNFLEKRDRIISLSQTYRNKSLHIQNSADDKSVFSGIARLLKEELTEIIHEVEADDTEETIVKQYPIIVAIGSTQQFFIHAQGHRISENFCSFASAVQFLIITYFIYYYFYPTNFSKTLEFLQIYFFKLVPNKGTRSRATIVGQQQRMVRTLLVKLAKLKN
ncbi:uncharacterized protein LOC131429251 [Malaya genurostris]|uniref:uncharacterized protein LOC131429251 n=1 Tax=Malaya genurostris TaxID=325434 RepID=UPI0026F3A44B|nr:uncharacterized protein LOC131429251 [Malaya genurostris]